MVSRIHIVSGVLAVALSFSSIGFARDIKITIPKRSHLTPVQKLNREGVEAMRKEKYERAESLFYRAYLFDPDDPFTLNNLGYISELQGQMDRAQQFYKQASLLQTDAVIDKATTRRMEGQLLRTALSVPDVPMQDNRDNVEALQLLANGRASEADALLRQTLARNPRDPFTLNNFGVTKEMEDEFEEALHYYDAASATGTDTLAVVTAERSWRGKPVSEIASRNAKLLRQRMATENTVASQVASLNLRGVFAANRNDLQTAAKDFRQAYALDPNNAFSLNNMGYASEVDGDRETAQFFYNSALRAGTAGMNVGLATRRSAEGMKAFQVADDSSGSVESALAREREIRQRQHAPVVLLRRDNTVVEEPTSQPQTPQNPTAQPK